MGNVPAYERMAYDSQTGCLVPVPVQKKRMKKRGYNQAAVLAERLSAYTGIPVLENWLVREGDTAPLKDLGAQERQNNLKKGF